MPAPHSLPARSLAKASGEWRDAADEEKVLRARRDLHIHIAHEHGVGVREIARLAGIDPTQVSRVLRRG
jgi:DNA-binding MarR family transcriptional regulator